MLRNPKVTRLIGICGNAGHGKDTLANRLAESYINPWICPFTEPLKLAAQALFGIDPYENDKEKICEVTGMSVRRTWQLLGTEALRKVFGDDIHIKMLDARLQQAESDAFIIPDVRFVEEADYIINNYGTLIHIRDPRKPVLSNHVSEQFAYQFSGYVKRITHSDQIFELKNDQSLEHLKLLADDLDENSCLTRAQYFEELELKKKDRESQEAPTTPAAQFAEDEVDHDEVKQLYANLKK